MNAIQQLKRRIGGKLAVNPASPAPEADRRFPAIHKFLTASAMLQVTTPAPTGHPVH